MDGNEMRYLQALLIAIILNGPDVQAQSTLLESVKRNPEEALALRGMHVLFGVRVPMMHAMMSCPPKRPALTGTTSHETS